MMTATERFNLIEQLEGAVSLLRALPIPTPCAECEAFKEPAWCTRWRDQVPEPVLAKGCEKWQPKVPF